MEPWRSKFTIVIIQSAKQLLYYRPTLIGSLTLHTIVEQRFSGLAALNWSCCPNFPSRATKYLFIMTKVPVLYFSLCVVYCCRFPSIKIPFYVVFMVKWIIHWCNYHLLPVNMSNCHVWDVNLDCCTSLWHECYHKNIMHTCKCSVV